MKDLSVFDLARLASNDNFPVDDPEDAPRKQLPKPFSDGELPVEISAVKERDRAFLENLGIGASVSLTTACLKAELPLDKGTRGEMKQPRAPAKWKPRKRKVANNNDPQSWPLLETLRRDGKESDIPTVRRYRMLCEAVAGCPYGIDAGLGANGEDAMGIGARSLRLEGKAFEKSFDKMTATELPGGEISYRENRSTMKQIDSVGQRINRLTEDTPSFYIKTPLSMAFRGGERISQIDGRFPLGIIREVLDVDPFDDGITLLPLFDDAVLGGMTLTFIGDRLGLKHKARSREAKRRVYTAIDIVRDEWRLIERYRHEREEACNRRVEARRAELAAQRAAYLGIAA